MKIAIAGYGAEGRANYAYWAAKEPAADITIVNQTELDPATVPDGASVMTGPDVFSQLDGFDMVIRTPSLAPSRIHTNGQIWSGTNEFMTHCPAPVIGVTGSKGKGTTASLIASILEADGKKVWLVGNIGIAALEVLPQIQPTDYVVYELSSFQLWDLQKSPQTAVVLYIEQEHLDVHADMDDYVQAKAQITRTQGPSDRLIYWRDNQYTQHIASQSQAQKISVPSAQAASFHRYDETFDYADQTVCRSDVMRLKGDHNLMNAMAAIDAVWPFLDSQESIAKGLAAFTGLPHRLNYVATVAGVEYYDDSIATTPTSAIAALRAFPARQQKVIILGGSSKGSDFTELAEEMSRHDDVTALLIGDEAARLQAQFDHHDFFRYTVVQDQTMPAVVQAAQDLAEPGAVVLLSPAAASFGLFKDYTDRGDQFVAAVRALDQ